MARAMKDSGIAWIGEIPEEWEIAKVSLLFDIQLGKMLQPEQYTDNDTFENYLCAANVGKNKLKLDTLKQMWFSEDDKQKFSVRKGDLLVVEGGDVASCDIITEEVNDLYIQNALHRVRSKSGYDIRILKYWLMVAKAIGYIDLICNKATIAHFTKDKFGAMPFVILPAIDQIHIADYLDAECARIDAVIEQTRASIEEYKKLKQAVITQAVTKGIRPNRPMKDSGVDWIGRLPEEWIVIRAKYCVEISNGTDPKTEGDIPVYGSGAASFKTCGEYKEGPCVLIGRKGATLHIPHYIEGKYWNVDTAFDVKAKQGYNLKYYYYAACCFDYKLYISQTTLPGMTQTNYENMSLPCPCLDEQQEIVGYLDEKSRDLDLLIQRKEQLLNDLETYKKSKIFEYVTGKKEVL